MENLDGFDNTITLLDEDTIPQPLYNRQTKLRPLARVYGMGERKPKLPPADPVGYVKPKLTLSRSRYQDLSMQRDKKCFKSFMDKTI